MSNFNTANQARLKLKMKLSNYACYIDSMVIFSKDEYMILVHTSQIDNKVKKLIPPIFDEISVKVELGK